MAVLLLWLCVAEALDLHLPLNRWPSVSSHDAATGYLTPRDTKDEIVYAWTKTQDVNLSTQLSCGARNLDLRPAIHNNRLVMHHGGVVIPHQMDKALDEIVQWANTYHDGENDLVLLNIWDCRYLDEVHHAPDCLSRVKSAVKKAGIPSLSCDGLLNATVGSALQLSQLADGGHILAYLNCNNPDPSFVTFDEDLACAGFTDPNETATWREEVDKCLAADQGMWANCFQALDGLFNTSLHYSCYPGGLNREFAFQRLLAFNTNLSSLPPPNYFYSLMGAWASTDESVAMGFLQNSSLIQEEKESGLNARLTGWVQDGMFKHVPSMIGINNVCNGGLELMQALRAEATHKLSG